MADQKGTINLLRRLSVNYLALGQFELARGAIQELGRLDQESAVGILRAVAHQSTPRLGWLASAGVPSPAHLSWLAQCELALTASPGDWEDRGHIEHALLRTIAAALQQQAAATTQSDTTRNGERSASVVEKKTFWQSQEGAARAEQGAMQTDMAERSWLPPPASRESLLWLLQNEPQLLRSLGEKESSGAIAELLIQQWEENLEGRDIRGICNTIAHLVKGGDRNLLTRYRTLLDRTLHLGSPQEGSTTHTLLWNAAAASDIEDVSILLEAAQDAVVATEAEAAARQQTLSPPLAQLRAGLKGEGSDPAQLVEACAAELFHGARVTRTHVLETVAQEALRAVGEKDMQKAADILMPYPELAPLIAVMGWDLHAGDVAARQDVLQRMWQQRTRPQPQEQRQASPIEALCDQLSYQLRVAKTTAASITGEDRAHVDDFAANLLLERLAAESPIRVLTDPAVPLSKEAALALVSQQPVGYLREAAQARQHDVELLRLHLALQAALRVVEHAAAIGEVGSTHEQRAEAALEEAAQLVVAVGDPWKKAWLVGTLAALLPLRSPPPLLFPPLSQSTGPPQPTRAGSAPSEKSSPGAPLLLATRFIALLQQHLPLPDAFLSPKNRAPPAPSSSSSGSGPGEQSASRVWAGKVDRWRGQFEDWHWRLQLLQKLTEQQGEGADWADCVGCLQTSPAQLLDRCIQAGNYDLGREVAARFSMTATEIAPLELAAWLDQIPDTLNAGSSSRGASKDVLDFSSLGHKLSPLTSLLVCLDVAISAARSSGTVICLLSQAKGFAQQCRERRAAVTSGSEREGAGPPPSRAGRASRIFGFSRKSSSSVEDDRPLPADDWTSPRVQAVFAVADGLLQQLHDRQSQDLSVPLPAMLSRSLDAASGVSPSGAKAGPNLRAITALQAAIKDAHEGKRQFLSGKLHNLVKALAEDDDDSDPPALTKSKPCKPSNAQPSKPLLGAGLSVPPGPLSPASSGGDFGAHTGSWGSLLDGDGGGPTSPLARSARLEMGSKRASFLSAFVHYIATIGDIMDEVDTTHTYNFFSILYETPDNLLAQLAFERGSTDTASRAAELMGADLTRQLLSSSVGSILPPSHDARTTSAGPKRPLEVEVARFVARSSPQQAILAALLGSKAVQEQGEEEGGGRGEARRQGLRDLALELADSFPVLHRWLLLQEGPPASTPPAEVTEQPITDAKPTPTARFKRLRESDDTSSDDFSPSGQPDASDEARSGAEGRASGMQSGVSGVEGPVARPWRKAVPPAAEGRLPGLVEWEDERTHTAAVDELMRRGALREALDLADARLLSGAPDELLLAVIEQEGTRGGERREQGRRGPPALQGWQACLRLRDKERAARTALRCLRRWELAAGGEVLAMCAAHLAPGSTLRQEVLARQTQLKRYKIVMEADPSFDTWQQVEDLYLADPEGLTLRLSSLGAVAASLEVARSVQLLGGLRHELESRQLVQILTGKVTDGAGPAAAVRYLKGLWEPGEAMVVVTGALPQLGQLKDKSLLVRHLLAHPPRGLPEPDQARLRSLAVGLRALGSLPGPWQQRCGHLAEYPPLVLESLLMAKQFKTAHKMLQACPSLQDDALILRYAAKALAPPSPSEPPPRPPNPPQPPLNAPSSSTPGDRSRHTPPEFARSSTLAIPRAGGERPPGSALRSSSTASGLRGVLTGSEGPSMPRRISWAAGTSTMWAAASQFTRGLLHQGNEETDSPRAAAKPPPAEAPPSLPPFQSAAWEAMSGPAETRGIAVQGAQPKGRVVGDAGLTGDAAKDETTRRGHTFEGAPSAAVLKALLPLCADIPRAVSELLAFIAGQCERTFAVPASSPARMEHGLRVADAFVETLEYLEQLLPEAANVDPNKALLQKLRGLLPRLEVVQALLRAGVPVSYSELQGREARAQLRDRLVQDERFELAHTLCTKCGPSLEPVEMTWGKALLAIGEYQQARDHLRAALEGQDEVTRRDTVRDIVAAIEAAPPVDLQQTRSLYSEMARSVALSSEEAFSFDAYLNVLNAPPEQRPPVSRRSSGEQSESGSFGKGPEGGGPESSTDYLDERRKDEALAYVQQYHRSDVLPFLFRHGHFSEACRLFLAHLPPPPVPPAPAPGGAAQRAVASPVDPLVSEYGSLEELCELCVTYGAMPVLEKAVEEKGEARGGEWAGQQAAVLAKMAAFCELHRHFHHLYRIQLLQKDHVAAGLTCIQLFHNSATADEAVQHLEAARDHFDDGLSARQVAPPESGRRAKEGRKSASAKLSEEEIIKFSTRVALQAEVVRAFGDGEGPPWQHSLFGNPSDTETVRRRTEVAEQLAERNFDLAFRVIYDFRLPAVDTYAGASASMARRRKASAVAELLKNVTGTIDDDERDQVLLAAINVYASQHKEHPASLIDQLSNSHRKVLACVASGRLKSAFQFASRANNLPDVQLVAHQARETGQLSVMDLCHQWLAKNNQAATVR